jgi:hypothetical protein
MEPERAPVRHLGRLLLLAPRNRHITPVAEEAGAVAVPEPQWIGTWKGAL